MECEICNDDLVCPHCYSEQKEDLRENLVKRLDSLLLKYFPDVKKTYRNEVAEKGAIELLKEIHIAEGLA